MQANLDNASKKVENAKIAWENFEKSYRKSGQSDSTFLMPEESIANID